MRYAEIPVVLAECRRVLKSSGHLAVAALPNTGSSGLAVEVYEWTRQHFPNLLDCRPIFESEALVDAVFTIENWSIESTRVPVEPVLARRIVNTGVTSG